MCVMCFCFSRIYIFFDSLNVNVYAFQHLTCMNHPYVTHFKNMVIKIEYESSTCNTFLNVGYKNRV